MKRFFALLLVLIVAFAGLAPVEASCASTACASVTPAPCCCDGASTCCCVKTPAPRREAEGSILPRDAGPDLHFIAPALPIAAAPAAPVARRDLGAGSLAGEPGLRLHLRKSVILE
jgi:hypothetical protein